MPSQSSLQYNRVNLRELKSQIAKNIGHERTKRYFGYLSQFLSGKLSKPNFNKYCLLVLGHENIALHNQLIRSILKNALLAKSPPQTVHEKVSISAHVEKKASGGDGSNCMASQTLPTVWTNGDILPPSPRKVRSSIRERRSKDRQSPLVGSNAQADVAVQQALMPADNLRVNVSASSHELKMLAEQPAAKLRDQTRLLHCQNSSQNYDVFPVAEVDDRGELVEQCSTACLKKSPIWAPLGIPFCPASVGGAPRSSHLLSCAASTSCSSYSGELCNTEVLMSRLDTIAEAQGLGGVAIDCANLLNNGLDTYLKQLIRSSVDLVRARSEKQATKHRLQKQLSQQSHLNGVLPGSHLYVQNGLQSLDGKNQDESPCQISLEDLRVAMELNPEQLGEEWPLLLEKICVHSFGE